MRSIFGVWLFCILGFVSCFLSSCEEDIDLYTKEAKIAVYCLLNTEDSVQVVRVSKTFPTHKIEELGNDELLLHDELEVFLVEELQNKTQKYLKCELSDSYFRDSGRFASGILQNYVVKCSLKKNQKYSLIIYQKADEALYFGTTTTLHENLQIIDPIFVPHRRINIYPNRDFYIRFSNVENAFVYQATFYFEYDEIEEGYPTRKQIDLPQEFVYPINGGENFLEQRVAGKLFFEQLAMKIPHIENITRVPVALSIKITCCGEEIALNVKSNLSKSAFSIQEFSSFTNSPGLFSSINFEEVYSLPLSSLTIDSLLYSSITKDLNFVPYAEN